MDRFGLGFDSRMEYRTLIYGVLLLAMMRFQPGGLLGADSVLPKLLGGLFVPREAGGDR